MSTDSQPANKMLHALSFDIEDWFHIVDIPACDDPESWSSFPSIVERRTEQILEILDAFDTKATFFILGWIADKYPKLVQRIAEGGHELATHSFWHRRVYQLSPEQFRQDIADSIAAIEQPSGCQVRGFRAPSFSITPGTEWAFDVLAECGVTYDASLFPAARAHGGYMCDPGPGSVVAASGRKMAELPMSTMGLLGKRVCYSGGGYFRLFPLGLINAGIKQAAREGRPTVIYLHPRDFATDCPKVPMPPHRRFKCYVGRASTEKKLRTLLKKYRFGTCREVLENAFPNQIESSEPDSK